MRDRALVRAARTYIERERLKGRTPTMTEAAEAVVSGPAPSFFISFAPLYNGVCRLLGEEGTAQTDAPTTLSQQRLHDVAARVRALRQEQPRTPLTVAVTQVMARGGAPRFYITADHARRILCRNLLKPSRLAF